MTVIDLMEREDLELSKVLVILFSILHRNSTISSNFKFEEIIDIKSEVRIVRSIRIPNISECMMYVKENPP